MKKQYKIVVVVSTNKDERVTMLKKVIQKAKFARTLSDAGKLIESDIYNVSLPDAYFVAADNFDFRTSHSTNQRLYEMAARGLFVAVAVKKLPHEFDFICEPFYPSDQI